MLFKLLIIIIKRAAVSQRCLAALWHDASMVPTQLQDKSRLMQTLCPRFLWGELAARAHADGLLQPAEVTPELTARRCAACLPLTSSDLSFSFCPRSVGWDF